MAILTKQNYKWYIVLSFIGIITVPGMIASPTFKTISVLGLGGICLLLELLYLKNLNSKDENYKSDSLQTLVLIVVTILLIVVNFFV